MLFYLIVSRVYYGKIFSDSQGRLPTGWGNCGVPLFNMSAVFYAQAAVWRGRCSTRVGNVSGN